MMFLSPCRHWVGDSNTNFTMQSGNKCFTYALAVDEYGSDAIHDRIGKEPSGASFNSLFLNSDGKAAIDVEFRHHLSTLFLLP